VSKTNNTIKLNGKHFDATTGTLLDDSADTSKHKSPATAAHRQAAKHAAAHTPEHAKTLMRHSVKRPAAHQPKRSAAVVATPKPLERVAVATRLQHAKRIPKSNLISHFNPAASIAAATTTTETPVVTTGTEATSTAPQEAPAATSAMLQRALEHATAHEQPAPKTRRRGLAKHRGLTVASMVAVVALVGLFASQNLSGLRIQMASSKAGFSAALPGYHPAGFRLSQLDANPGIVAFNYISNSDQDRQISVTEKSSTWTNQDLVDNFIQPNSQQYRAVHQNGQTYYLYDSHNVTWISGGVWYQVHSQDALGDQQLLRLADSL